MIEIVLLIFKYVWDNKRRCVINQFGHFCLFGLLVTLIIFDVIFFLSLYIYGFAWSFLYRFLADNVGNILNHANICTHVDLWNGNTLILSNFQQSTLYALYFFLSATLMRLSVGIVKTHCV